MKILITGGAGFIASNIADAYIALGHRVVVLDNMSSGRKEFINSKAKFYKTDILDKKAVREIFLKEKPDLVNHHAAQISVRHSVEDPADDASINILGFLNILESAKEVKVKKIIFASSGGVVYGDAKIIPTPETYTPLQPQSPYGVTKLASEYYLHIYHQSFGIPYVALRYSNVYGPRQNPHGEAGVVAIFSMRYLKNEPPLINGKGTQTRDYIFVGDVVAMNKICLTGSYTGPVNVGTGKETDVLTISRLIRKNAQSMVQAKYGPAKTGEQQRSCLNNSFALKSLGWKPMVELGEGIRRTVEYFKNL